MNACEPLQIAQMNLRPGRGRSIERLTEMALQRLRAERSAEYVSWHIRAKADGKIVCLVCGTFRKALFARARWRAIEGVDCYIIDALTGIRVA